MALLEAPITAAGCASFVDGDFAKLGQDGFDTLPDPSGKLLGGGIFEAFNFVEAGVIEFFVQGCPRFLEGLKIGEPAGFGMDFTFDRDLDQEAMSVHPSAFVAFWHFG